MGRSSYVHSMPNTGEPADISTVLYPGSLEVGGSSFICIIKDPIDEDPEETPDKDPAPTPQDSSV